MDVTDSLLPTLGEATQPLLAIPGEVTDSLLQTLREITGTLLTTPVRLLALF